MGKAQAALQEISKQFVNVSQDCFAQASNLFQLNLQGDEVSIDGLTVNSNIGTKLGTCSATTGIAEGPLHESVNRALTNIGTKGLITDAYSKVNIDMKTTIADNITVDVANRCLAVALNNMVIRVSNARQISLANVTVNQSASAEINECMSNIDVKIGNTKQSLQQFLERNEDQYTVQGYTEPVCTAFNAAKEYLYGGCGVLGFALILCACVVLYHYIRWRRRQKK